MELIAQLEKQKDAVAQSWFERVINTYPPETAHFLAKQKDPFANPVGQTTYRSLTLLVDLLCKGLDREAARDALDPIIRVRAIQSFTASQATGFVFDLKQVIRKKCAVKPADADQMAHIDYLIDQLVLIAFDLFMQCREKIYDLKANETKQRTFKAFAKAGLIKEPEDE
jgi:hypothetical protein